MRIRFLALFITVLFAGATALAKGKQKEIFPPGVLAAHTVAVIIDPESGISADDPQANQVARKDVESALLNWGRFQSVAVGQPADLIIVVRCGQKHSVDDTIRDPRQNNRSGAITPADDGIQFGGQRGQPAGATSAGPDSSGSPANSSNLPSTQMEVGPQQDSFLVYNGTVSHPLDNPPVWRYMAVDALRPHSVPAVSEFRKAIAAAEKAAAQKP